MVRIQSVAKGFGSRIAVNDLTLDVPAGQIFAFLGPNGAGKSTTIKLLSTVIRPTRGEIWVCGKSVTKNAYSVRCELGVVFQEASLDEMLTVYENLALHGALHRIPHTIRQERIAATLSEMDLHEHRDRLVRVLSTGMKRRVDIARALLHQPKLLVLDEPTVGLDVQTRSALWSYVRRLNRRNGLTVFCATHYLEEAETIADRVGIIKAGRLIADGSPLEIMESQRANSLEQAYLKLTGESSFNSLFDSCQTIGRTSGAMVR